MSGREHPSRPSRRRRIGWLLRTTWKLTRAAPGPAKVPAAVAAVAMPLRRRLGRRGDVSIAVRVRGRPHRFLVADRSEIETLVDVLADEQYSLELDGPGAIVDLGAHIGAAAVLLARSHPGRAVLAVEPDPDTVRRLRRNVAGESSITVVEAAVGADDGSAMLRRDAAGSWASSLVGGAGDGVEVAVRSLTGLLDEHGVDRVALLKLDIEGAEYEVLRRFELADRVAMIVAELHPWLATAVDDETVAGWLPGYRTKIARFGRDRQLRAVRAP